MKILLSAVAVLVFLAAITPTAMAVLPPIAYVDGWLDGYSNWIHLIQTGPKKSTPDYLAGFNGGWQYGSDKYPSHLKHGTFHVKVPDIKFIEGWIDGLRARTHGLQPAEKAGTRYLVGFNAGYVAPDNPTLVLPKSLEMLLHP